MSISRHKPSLVRSYSVVHPPGLVSLPTEPGWDQVVLAHRGHFTARTESQVWAVPALRALCLPADTPIRIDTTRRTAIRCLYTQADLGLVGQGIRLVNVEPLTRELLLHAVVSAPMALLDDTQRALITLLTDQLRKAPDAALQLPYPVDDSARAAAAIILEDPSKGLDEVASLANASRRSLERRFKSETHMTLGRWRRRARIHSAVTMLAGGDSVASTAHRAGYGSPSSFIAAFGSELGSTPGEFFRPGR